jgi:hypothetical protein
MKAVFALLALATSAIAEELIPRWYPTTTLTTYTTTTYCPVTTTTIEVSAFTLPLQLLKVFGVG